MFLAYPMGGLDDDQAYQRYLVGRLLTGDLHIGNVRYNTGYALLMAPVYAWAGPFGPLRDRFVLLVQIALSSLIPLLAYSAVRRFDGDRAALAISMFVLLDPVGLQWAHMALPVWVVALGAMFGYWFLRKKPDGPRDWLWSALAGIVMALILLCRNQRCAAGPRSDPAPSGKPRGELAIAPAAGRSHECRLPGPVCRLPGPHPSAINRRADAKLHSRDEPACGRSGEGDVAGRLQRPGHPEAAPARSPAAAAGNRVHLADLSQLADPGLMGDSRPAIRVSWPNRGQAGRGRNPVPRDVGVLPGAVPDGPSASSGPS